MAARVCFVAPASTNGGNHTTALRVCDLLRGQGLRVDQCVPNEIGALAATAFDAVLYLHAYRTGTHVFAGESPPALKARRYILVLGGTDANEDFGESIEAAMANVVSRSDLVICFSESLKQQAMAKWNLNSEKCRIARQAIMEVAAEPRPLLGLPGRRVVLLSAGLRKVKGIAFALQGWKLLREHYPDVPLDLVVAGPNMDDEVMSCVLDAMATDETIHYRSDLNRSGIMAAIHDPSTFCAINTSESEGQPQAILEAMACGCLVAVRAIAGNVDVVDETRGRVFGSEREMADKLMELFKLSGDECGLLRTAAHDFVQKYHSPDSELQAYLAACSTPQSLD